MKTEELEIKPLTLVEKNNLQYHVQRVKEGLETTRQVAESLTVIKEGNLYRETHPNDFTGFCRDEFGIGRRWADKMIRGMQVINALSADGKLTSSVDLDGASRLGSLPMDEQLRVIEAAPKKSGRITQKAITEALRAHKEANQSAGVKSPPSAPEPTPSIALQQAASAIASLSSIPVNDPLREDAFKKVTDYINRQTVSI